MSCHASYQTEGKVEQSRAAVEQDGEERGRRGDEEANVPTHYHPKRLQDLWNDKTTVNIFWNITLHVFKLNVWNIECDDGLTDIWKQNICKSLPHRADSSETHPYLQTAESQYFPAERRQRPSSPGCPLTSCSAAEQASSDHDGVRSGSRSGHM